MAEELVGSGAGEMVEPGADALPAELCGAPPREVPDALYEGPLAQRRKRGLAGCFAAGAVCMALAPLPFVKTMAIYFLPLAYLNWISLVLAVIGAAVYIEASALKKARKYIEQGEVALARVIEMVKAPVLVQDGIPTTFAFLVRIEVPAASGADGVQMVEVKSPMFGVSEKNRVATRFRVGDLVPVVWLPGKMEKTIQIYDFLEATDEHSLVRAKADTGTVALIKLAGGIAFLILFFFALFWNVYAHGRYQPLDFDYPRQGWAPFAIAGVLAIVGAVIGLRTRAKRKHEEQERMTRSVEAGEAVEVPYAWGLGTWAFMVGLIFPGTILLGGMTMLCWCFTANALLDDSAAERTPVEITEMTETTHNFVLRHYDMKFKKLGEEEDHGLLTTPEHMEQFAAPLGMAVVRKGWLGWPWVETVEPLVGR